MLVSREWERMYDVTREAAIGKNDFDLFPKQIADARRTDEIHTLGFGRMVTKVDLVGTRYNAFKPTRVSLIPLKVGDEPRYSYLAGFTLPPYKAWEE